MERVENPSYLDGNPLTFPQWGWFSNQSHSPSREPAKKKVSKATREYTQGDIEGQSSHAGREPREDCGQVLRRDVHFLVEPGSGSSITTKGTC